MKLHSIIIITATSLLTAGLMLNAYGDDTAVSTGSTSIVDSPAIESSVPELVQPSFAIGADTYLGGSNMSGIHRFSDGIWAGAGAYYPSVSYLQWQGSRGDVVKLTAGMGEISTGSASYLHQPIEAYWQRPMGKAQVTVGKFWVPFAQQEWLYESKPGISAQWSGEKSSFIAAANLTTESHSPVMYLRGTRKVANDVEVGASLALGRGFCSDSSHNRGISLDTNIGFSGFRFYGEGNSFGARKSGNSFGYLSGKLYYEKLGTWKPFIANFRWNDKSGALGNFRSTACGIDYQLTPNIGVEGAIADTSGGNVSWVQVHWTWAKPFGISKKPINKGK